METKVVYDKKDKKLGWVIHIDSREICYGGVTEKNGLYYYVRRNDERG